MELLFFGGRHRYPGEVVPWSEYFGEWLEHPILAALALFCMIWMFFRMYGVWKMQREEKEERKQAATSSDEDSYWKTLPSHRVPEGATPYQGGYFFVKCSLWMTLFAVGLVGVGSGGYKDFLVFLLYAVLWL